MKFSFVTLFSNLIEGYFQDSILSRSIEKELFSIEYINPREQSNNKHQKVDAPCVGGGAGDGGGGGDVGVGNGGSGSRSGGSSGDNAGGGDGGSSGYSC